MLLNLDNLWLDRQNVSIQWRPRWAGHPERDARVRQGRHRKESALWNPEDLGYLSAFAAKAIITGEIKGDEGDKFTAGKLGEKTVGADKTVLLGDPFQFNKENIDQFDF